MATYTDIFFNLDKNLDDGATVINDLLRLQLVRGTRHDGRPNYECDTLDLHITLYDNHGYEDEPRLGLLFSQYRYVLGFGNWRNHAESAVDMRQMVAWYAYRVMVDVLGCSAMLVEDIQHLVHHSPQIPADKAPSA
jgi:hypothetical protein